MSIEREKLKAARRQLNLSQEEIAAQLKVGVSTYQRWEAGTAQPHPYNKRRLCDIFHASAHELGLDNSIDRTVLSAIQADNLVRASANIELQVFIAQDLTLRLQAVAYGPYCNYDEFKSRFACILKETDAMNTDNKNYQMTRRDALCRLAVFPIVALGLANPQKILQPVQYGEVIPQMAASVEACYKLSQSSNASDLLLAFECVSRYLPVLKSIVATSSQYRKEAADLAARYALLRTILGWHCKGLTEAIHYAKDAVVYSNEAADRALQLSSYSKLAWAYFYDKKNSLALQTAQQARFLLEREESTSPVLPCIRGGTYSTLALMQVKNGADPSEALGKAAEIDPGDECHSFMEFTRSDVPSEAALVNYYKGDQAKVTQDLATLIDSTTLSLKSVGSERGRISWIRIMALSSLRTEDRDLERTAYLWKAVLDGARALHSEWAFHEALGIYELMEVAWPGEVRVKGLQTQIEHW